MMPVNYKSLFFTISIMVNSIVECHQETINLIDSKDKSESLVSRNAAIATASDISPPWNVSADPCTEYSACTECLAEHVVIQSNGGISLLVCGYFVRAQSCTSLNNEGEASTYYSEGAIWKVLQCTQVVKTAIVFSSAFGGWLPSSTVEIQLTQQFENEISVPSMESSNVTIVRTIDFGSLSYQPPNCGNKCSNMLFLNVVDVWLPPNVISVYNSYSTRLSMELGLLRNLSDIWEELDIANRVPVSTVGISSYASTPYAIPVSFSYQGLFYNLQVFQALGFTEIPQTWDQLLTLLRAFQAAFPGETAFGISAILDQNPNGELNYNFIEFSILFPNFIGKLFGCKAVQDFQSGALSMNDPVMRTALVEFINFGLEFFPKNLGDFANYSENELYYTQVLENVMVGKVFMTTQNEDSMSGAPTNIIEAAIGFIPFVSMNQTIPNCVLTRTQEIFIPVQIANGEYDYAVDFTKSFITDDAQLQFLYNGIIPGTKEAMNSPNRSLFLNFYQSAAADDILKADEVTDYIDFQDNVYYSAFYSFLFDLFISSQNANELDTLFMTSGLSTVEVLRMSLYSQLTAPVDFSPTAGVYNNEVTVTLSCITPSATIFYTIDGSEASTTSLLYQSGIQLSSTTTIRAVAISPGKLPSNNVGYSYRIDSTVTNNQSLKQTAKSISEYIGTGVAVIFVIVGAIVFLIVKKRNANDCVIEEAEIKLGEKIASGATSIVYVASWKELPVVVKLVGVRQDHHRDLNFVHVSSAKLPIQGLKDFDSYEASPNNNGGTSSTVSGKYRDSEGLDTTGDFDVESNTKKIAGSQGRALKATNHSTSFASFFLTGMSIPGKDTKRLNGNNMKVKTARNLIEREGKLLNKLKHPNIVVFYGYFFSNNSRGNSNSIYNSTGIKSLGGLVMEDMVGGSLYSVLHNLSVELDMNRMLGFIEDAAKGLSFLHAQTPPVIHKDVKSFNFLLDDRWRLKISDFGISHHAGSSEEENSVLEGSLPWLSPEALRVYLNLNMKASQTPQASSNANSSFNRHIMTKSDDVYAYGVVVWEILARLDPYGDRVNWTSHEDIGKIVDTNIKLRPSLENIVKIWPATIVNVMNSCWNNDAKSRPSMTEILEKIRSSKNEVEEIVKKKTLVEKKQPSRDIVVNDSNAIGLTRNAIDILRYILSKEELRKIMSGEETLPTQKFSEVAIFFADIVQYTNHSSKCDAAAVASLINSLFAKYRDAAKLCGVFEIETIGDMYIAATGFKDEEETHEKMVNFCQQVLKILSTFSWKEYSGEDEGVEMRIGIHSGPCTATIIGSKLTFLGDTVNVASRMESSGTALRIHASDYFVRKWAQNSSALILSHWTSKGCQQIKGKGSMETFLYKN